MHLKWSTPHRYQGLLAGDFLKYAAATTMQLGPHDTKSRLIINASKESTKYGHLVVLSIYHKEVAAQSTKQPTGLVGSGLCNWVNETRTFLTTPKRMVNAGHS